jgi:GMP synthase (glutamine-hydrolysing)
MTKYWIIKTGSTFDELKQSAGDFEDWIIEAMGIDADEAEVWNLEKKEELPEGYDTRGIIITGSLSNVTENLSWMKKFTPWIRPFFNTPVPVLGICFGHQLLADAFGGKVDFHAGGKEVGSVDIHLNAEGIDDSLFQGIPPTFTGYVCHSQTVTELPKDAIRLAHNNFEQNHAFKLGRNIRGVQFHPEFNATVTRYCVEKLAEDLRSQGLDPEQMYHAVEENGYGKMLLKRFKEIYRAL